jgi:hypothetical protein
MDEIWICSQLTDLRHHWGSAYKITCPGLSQWKAVRRDGQGQISADNAEELRDLIRIDYAECPVPR